MADKKLDIVGISHLNNQPPGAGSGEASPSPGLSAPLTPTEITIAEIWQSALPGIPFDRESNFIAIGGDSLALAQVIAQLESTFTVKLTVEGVANNLSLKDMAEMIDGLISTSKA